MQRFVIAILALAVLAALATFVVKSARAVMRDAEDGTLTATGASMQRIAFFLLLALMIYVFMSGSA